MEKCIFCVQRSRNGKLTACILLFTGIWIEKGFGLIIPGFIPSPLGELTDYVPTGVEISITLGIFAVGLFVITMLIRPLLMIEQRYEENVADK